MAENGDLTAKTKEASTESAPSDGSSANAAGRLLDDAISSAITNFARIDGNRDGFSTPTEVEQAINANSLTGTDATALALLKVYGDPLQSASNDEIGFENDGVTPADLQKFPNAASAEHLAGAREVISDARASIEFGTKELFAGKDGLTAVRPDAVKQGISLDCFFLASIGSLAQTRPADLASIISDNKDGSYTVTFPGDKTHPVTVKRPTDSELALYAKATEDGIWVPVLEKAFTQYLDENPSVRTKALSEEVKAGANGRAILEQGGRVPFALELLTGNSVSMIKPDENSDSARVAENISENLREALPVVASVAKDNSYAKSMGLNTSGHHAYSVLSYDSENQTYTIRNPYGRGEPTSSSQKDSTNDGTFKLTRDEFVRCFNEVCLVNSSPKTDGRFGGGGIKFNSFKR